MDETKTIEIENKLLEIESLLLEMNQSSSEAEEKIKYVASDQLSLSEMIRNKMKEDETAKEKLAESWKSSEKKSQETIEKLSEVVVGLNQEMEDLKKMNMEKIEKTFKILSEEMRKNEERNRETIRQIMDLIYGVKRIDNVTWMENVKRYGMDLGITIGMIVMLIGAWKGISLLIQLFSH